MKELKDTENKWIIDMFEHDYGDDLDKNKKDFLISMVNKINAASDHSNVINNIAQFMNVMSSRKNNKINRNILILNILVLVLNICIFILSLNRS